MNAPSDWLIRTSEPECEYFEATRNNTIQIGWIRNTIRSPEIYTYPSDFKIQFMLEYYATGASTIVFEDDTTLYIPAHCIHLSNPYKQMKQTHFQPGQYESYHIIIPPVFYDTLLTLGLIQPGIFILPPPTNFEWKTRISILADELMACKTHMLPAFLGRLYSEICEVLIRSKQNASSASPDLMQQVADLLSQAHESRLSLDEIATQFGITLRTLERQFRDFFGLSPKQFRIARRMELAARILQNDPHITIRNIAAKLGYCDPFAFSKHFKTTFGMPPSEYQHLPKNDSPISPEANGRM